MSSEIGKPGTKKRGADTLALAAKARAREHSPQFVTEVNRDPVPEYGRKYVRPHVKPTGREGRRI